MFECFQGCFFFIILFLVAAAEKTKTKNAFLDPAGQVRTELCLGFPAGEGLIEDDKDPEDVWK